MLLCPPRHVRYFKDAAGVSYRSLFKVYGIRFSVMVHGKVGRMDLKWTAGVQPHVKGRRLSGFAGRDVQHCADNHQRWFWSGSDGCCEYRCRHSARSPW